MSKLKNKIDFAVLVAVNMANPNGDPLNGNRPRIGPKGLGEITDVCIKRKIRNRMQDLGHSIFVQSEDRTDDGCTSLSERAGKGIVDAKTKEEYEARACDQWMDARAFGQVFAFKSAGSVSAGVRGPVSIHQAVSISPVDVQSYQITKSVNSEPKDKKGSDTMGMKHMVRFGLYLVKGSINVQLAEKTGFTEADAEVFKECLRTLFVNDASSARPEGSMEVVKVYWWKHNCKTGQYSAAKVHRQLEVTLKEGIVAPTSVDDYTIKVNALPDLEVEEIDGI